jgi:hypothetical protein
VFVSVGTRASAADASEVENIEPLPTAFGKIIDDGAPAGQEEKEREREAAMHRDRWGS